MAPSTGQRGEHEKMRDGLRGRGIKVCPSARTEGFVSDSEKVLMCVETPQFPSASHWGTSPNESLRTWISYIIQLGMFNSSSEFLEVGLSRRLSIHDRASREP